MFGLNVQNILFPIKSNHVLTPWSKILTTCRFFVKYIYILLFQNCWMYFFVSVGQCYKCKPFQVQLHVTTYQKSITADMKTMNLMFKNEYVWQRCEFQRRFLETNHRHIKSWQLTKFWNFTVGIQVSLKGQERMCYLSRVFKYLPLLATGSKVISPASLTTVLALSDRRLECKKNMYKFVFLFGINFTLYCIIAMKSQFF